MAMARQASASIVASRAMPRTFLDPAALRPHIVAPELRELLDYWLRIRGGRRLPGRQDVRPEEIPRRLLAHTGLIDVLPGRRFRYRLIGTAMVEFYGRDYTGLVIEEAKSAGYASVLNELYRLCAEAPAVVYSEARSSYRQGAARLMQRLLAPLSRDGEAADMILFSTIPCLAPGASERGDLLRLSGDDVVAIERDFEPYVAAA